MTFGQPGPGWWLASDGRWYPPSTQPAGAPEVHQPPQQSPAPPAPGWWIAADGNWYPPHQHPDYRPPQQAAPPPTPPQPSVVGAPSPPNQFRQVGGRAEVPALNPYFGAGPTTPGNASAPFPTITPKPRRRTVSGKAVALSIGALLLIAFVAIGVTADSDTDEAAAPVAPAVSVVEPPTPPPPGASPPGAPPPGAPPTTRSDRERQQLAMEAVWSELSVSDRAEVCVGVDTYGVELAAQQIVWGSGGIMSVDLVKDFLVGEC